MSFFFDTDVSVVGLSLESLDFAELHLGWLITDRARRLAQTKAKRNAVKYYCRGDHLDNAKIDLLKSIDVMVCPPGDGRTTWRSYYNEVIKALASDVG